MKLTTDSASSLFAVSFFAVLYGTSGQPVIYKMHHILHEIFFPNIYMVLEAFFTSNAQSSIRAKELITSPCRTVVWGNNCFCDNVISCTSSHGCHLAFIEMVCQK